MLAVSDGDDAGGVVGNGTNGTAPPSSMPMRRAMTFDWSCWTMMGRTRRTSLSMRCAGLIIIVCTAPAEPAPARMKGPGEETKAGFFQKIQKKKKKKKKISRQAGEGPQVLENFNSR